MGAPRRKTFIRSRKRLEDEGEEEEGSTALASEEDSLSETSVISDADDDADGEGSDDSDTGPPIPDERLANGHEEENASLKKQLSSNTPGPSLISVSRDTEAMMNGLKISEEMVMEEVNFDDIAAEPEVPVPIKETQSRGNASDKRRRDHEEYKRKRDADPAFVPNRGGFFMHDQRSAMPGQNDFRPFGKTSGKGRGGSRGSHQMSSSSQTLGPADSPWTHDLHETVAVSDASQNGMRTSTSKTQMQQHAPSSASNTQPPNRSFSRTVRLGDVQVRILLQGMSEPIMFSGVPRNSHTRLPHHRPPLRRDKPVRISIPEMSIRYIFPSTDRSFIFIPRALRPNQQGFGRTRGRGSFGPGFGSFGPLSSRRTSVFAGSAYSPSVAMSRRSSLAREVSAARLGSPTQARLQQQTSVSSESGKPVVRLPPSVEQQQQEGAIIPTTSIPPPSTYSSVHNPEIHEKRSKDLTIHHPKPERSLQVADIESPAIMDFNPPTSQQQPFHQQVPMQYVSQPVPLASLQHLPHSRHPSHPSQASGGTPLPQIPETAIHAQPFQPYSYPPQGYYPQQYPPPMYFFPPPDNSAGSPTATSGFVPSQQYFYPLPLHAAAPPQPPPPPQTESNTQSGTVAHEASGMVYYYNSSELVAMAQSTAAYPPTFTSAPPATMESLSPAPYYPQSQVYYNPPQ